ncbi:polyphosphate kinase [Agrilactobacillus composti DSM 18527 = JCM 14202]|uniref:Polyphosphate kinase n=1 Tax=Agrilactobacillus composti DSM 18527 = JCM 14202 TaxID=1423734 RepID=X0PDX6_9LACO|nr:polyphosphate kinase [Agrilactobacillus composti DSM 18527 = JCM 14202]GAF39388.1 polyphosphate kinase [Agrilactobacillus composti DSM 18527 = JCM 14202]
MNFDEPSYFNNRELSWLDFDDRVLEEARAKENPLLERLRFLGITQSNLDEFFNIRVASLHKMISVDYKGTDASGLTPAQQLKRISEKTHVMVEKQYNTLVRSLAPKLEEQGIHLLKMNQLSEKQKAYLDDYFHQNLYPVLTPMAVDVSRPFPFIANNTLNIALRISKPGDKKERSFATVQVPGVFPRVIKLPDADNNFILQEEVIKHYIGELFVGFDIKETACFRVIRDMDMDVADEDASDLMKEIESELKKRERGKAMRLEIEFDMSKHLRKRLVKELSLADDDIYPVKGPIDLTFVSKLIKQVQGHEDLLYPPFEPYYPKAIRHKNLFSEIAKRDIFVDHPYDSFQPVVDFIRQAAEDEAVLAIKMTLYRVSSKSPIITYLKQAAQNGKQVTVLVELKARFDEENNVHWAQELEKAGCHVIYGLVGLKTHCKLTLIVRREEDGIRRYMHMATGNYNDVTARLYTDMGLFTANPEMGIDASNIFNMLSGFSEPPFFHKLVISPEGIRDFLIDRVDDEIANVKAGKKGFIQMKMNSLSDTKMIKKFYEASAAGVKINLLVRGICNLRVGIPGISENITVHSIVGRFLEHSRIYYFYAAGEEKVFLSSSDLMNRNLSRRVELLFPILQDNIRKQIIHIYGLMWDDNVKTRVLQPDNTWEHVDRRGLDSLDVQAYLLDNREEIADYLFEHEPATDPDEPKQNTRQFIPITKQPE